MKFEIAALLAVCVVGVRNNGYQVVPGADFDFGGPIIGGGPTVGGGFMGSPAAPGFGNA